MFTLRKWLSTEVKPRLIIIFEGWTFLPSPSQECIIYFIIPKLPSRMQYLIMVLMRKMWILGETKKCRQHCLDLVSNVLLDLNKKTSTHTWWFHQKQRCYGHFNATKYMFHCHHCYRTSDRYEPYAHQCCACESKLSQGDSKNCHPPVYGCFTWEIHVRYNNILYHPPKIIIYFCLHNKILR